MAVRIRAERTRRNDDGAILPTAAIFLIALAAFAGLTLAGGSVYAAAQDGRRAADLAALGGAANLPTLNLGKTTDPNPLGLPVPMQRDTPLGTLDLSAPLPTLHTDFTSGVCAIAARQFGRNHSPVNDNYKIAEPTCTPSFHLENEWLQELADCLGGPLAAADCANRLEAGLNTLLPAPLQANPVVPALQTATTAVGAKGQVVTSELMTQIRALNTTLGGRLSPLLDQLNAYGGVDIDMTRLAPAILTPEVTVKIVQQVDVPGADLVNHGPVDVTSAATARRVIKNAVVAPTARLRPDGKFVIDANPALTSARDKAFTALDRIADHVTPKADQALTQVACPGTGVTCPTVSNAFDSMMADLSDAIDPPNGTAPDQWQLIQAAVADGRPIMMATASLIADPKAILGSTVYSLPGVAQLLPDLLFIPALELVPVVLSAGPIGQVIATPVNTAITAGQTKGLYRARLVD